MKRMGSFLSVLVMVIGLSVSAHAALVDMNDGTIYDTDTQLSWLKNAGAGGLKNWANANIWIASLNAGSGFAGLTGWRLPNADPACGINALNCITSEMGHLYYTELANPAGGPLTNTGPFTNLSASLLQWTGTQALTNPLMYFAFSFYSGTQYREYPTTSLYAWAVRPGARSQASHVPASGTVGLIGLGLAGLIIVGMRLRKATS